MGDDESTSARFDQAAGEGQSESVAGVGRSSRGRVVGDPQIPSQSGDRMLAVPLLIELPGQLHGTTPELRWMTCRHGSPLRRAQGPTR